VEATGYNKALMCVNVLSSHCGGGCYCQGLQRNKKDGICLKLV
jgi:hypothetical protein